jgi:hypothetical protein
MLRSINQFFNQVFRKTRTVNNEPLNRVSLIVILLVDLFIIGNVFSGLDAISNWHLSPSEIAPCRSEWVSYRDDKRADRDYQILQQSLGELIGPNARYNGAVTVAGSYRDSQIDRLGKVAPICLDSGQLKDGLNSPANRQLYKQINDNSNKISTLKSSIETIKSQYDSTLLEKIAGQAPGNSINNVKAEKAKETILAQERQIAELNGKLKTEKIALVDRPENQAYLSLLKDGGKFEQVDQAYKTANFWYPSIRLGLQGLFLLPLMAIALGIHNLALSKGYGLVGLMAWHLLCIFFIPLIFKIFEFLQFGFLFQAIFDFVISIVGNLVFLLNYISILSIPVIGFGIIKLVQSVLLNPKSQASRRVQKNQCLKCAKSLQPGDSHCPHCGYHQQIECPSCHAMTYKHLPHCRHCGASQT